MEQKLELSENAIKRHIKRLQEKMKIYNNDFSLSKSQEFFSKILGFKNYNELKTLLNEKKAVIDKLKMNENFSIEQSDNEAKQKLEKDFKYNINIEKYLHVKYKKSGLVLISGKFGSGKSTLLNSISNSLSKNNKVITYEIPVVHEYENIEQIKIENNLTVFSQTIKNSLRRNADIVFINELKNKETLNEIINIVECGISVFSSLITSNILDSLNEIYRLCDFNKIVLSNYLKNIKILINQKLIQNDRNEILMLQEFLPMNDYVIKNIIKHIGTKKFEKNVSLLIDTYGASYESSLNDFKMRNLLN
jgi:DNA replication protein DnaC